MEFHTPPPGEPAKAAEFRPFLSPAAGSAAADVLHLC
jgi:hypothetical protein